MALRAIKPRIRKPKRAKILVYSKEKVGKTRFACGFPNSYFIDSEDGAIRDQYQTLLEKGNSMYFGKAEGSLDFFTVLREIKELALSKHGYKTLTIDSFSKLYNTTRAIAEEKIGSAYGADKKEANKPARQLIRWLDAMDMNVILTCHRIGDYKGIGNDRQLVGWTFDGFDKLGYELDLLLEAVKEGENRYFIVRGSRVENMPEGMTGPLEYSTFAKLYGEEIIEKEAIPIVLVTPTQLQNFKELLETNEISHEKADEWLRKTNANADSWEEITFEQMNTWIEYLKGKAKKSEEIDKESKAIIAESKG